MLHVFAGWLVAALCLWGLGASLCRLLRMPGALRRDGFLACWMGWALLLALLQLWHLGLPLDGRAAGLGLVLGLVGCAWNLRTLGASLRRRVRPVFAGVFPLAALGMANLALFAPGNPDTGAYSLATVRWLSTFPIVPGLGNLMDRLGFNQTYFLYAAVLDVGPFHGRAQHLANGLLLLLLLGRSLQGALQLLRVPPEQRAAPLFAALFLPVTVWMILGWNLSSLSPDTAIFALGYVVGELLLRRSVLPSGRPRTERALVACIALLSAVGLTVKLSWVGFGLVCYALALGGGRTAARTLPRQAPWLFAGVLLPWMARGVLWTGYPLYPSPLGGFPVDWRVPRETVENLVNFIRAYGRIPGLPPHQVLGHWDWLAPWAGSLTLMNWEVLLPVTLFLGAGLSLLARRLSGRREEAGPGPSPWLLLAPAAGLLFWFTNSPDPRFSGACFWLLAVDALLLALHAFTGLRHTSTLQVVLVLVALATAGSLTSVTPSPGDDYQPLPTARTRPFRTDWGLDVEIGPCWDAPLLCAATPIRHLRLRQEGVLSSGFKLETHPDAPASAPAERFHAYHD